MILFSMTTFTLTSTDNLSYQTQSFLFFWNFFLFPFNRYSRTAQSHVQRHNRVINVLSRQNSTFYKISLNYIIMTDYNANNG